MCRNILLISSIVSFLSIVMFTVISKFPPESEVPEIGMFRRSPAEMMRDFARQNLQLDASRNDEPSSPGPATRHEEQERKGFGDGKSSVLTNGSLRLLQSAKTKTETSENVPAGSDDEREKKLQHKNLYLDLSQYVIPQKPVLDFSKYVINRPDLTIDIKDESKDVMKVPDVHLDITEGNGNIKQKKPSRFQRLRRSLQDLKKRVARPFTLLTDCFNSNQYTE
ncbi:hypothetical protein LOTGIDRAFT_166931 [Lottia gigantea]|uniref:Uncharacterized protein n=1 Tax=Lottia gigantea TaxID=225164 RepID=V4BDI5_LOTGI|nr:hypothetical protein LOTGIDRAFT_166931 [Lottia gigantea]ESO86659.1 hypothetical protein LOTGIDRAFT_166931 [Lottia gigantea]